jgi:hypothetical protein
MRNESERLSGAPVEDVGCSFLGFPVFFTAGDFGGPSVFGAASFADD